MHMYANVEGILGTSTNIKHNGNTYPLLHKFSSTFHLSLEYIDSISELAKTWELFY